MSPTATQPPGSPHDGLLGRPQSPSHSLPASVSLPPTASIFPFRFVSGQSPHLASPPSVYQSKDTRYKQAKLQEIQIENARKKSQGFLQKYEALEYRADRHRATWKGFIGPEQLGSWGCSGLIFVLLGGIDSTIPKNSDPNSSITTCVCYLGPSMYRHPVRTLVVFGSEVIDSL